MGLDILIMVCCPWIIAAGVFIVAGAYHQHYNFRDGIIGVLMTVFGILFFVLTAFKLGL